MSAPSALTAEMYQAVVAIVDERVREIRVTRQDFDALKGVVSELAQAQARTEARLEELTQAQARTEASVRSLAEAQARTEASVRSLAEAQARTEASVRALAEAQARTEERVGGLERAMQELTLAQARTQTALQDLAQQVGRLSDNIGYGLEDMARSMLPGYLATEFGFYFEVVRRRLFRVNGEVIDLDIYSEGEREDGQPAVLLGEVQARIYRREVEQFLRRTRAIEPLVEGAILKLMFGYFIDLSAMEAAGEDVLLVPSYEPTVRYHQRRREERRRRQQA